MLKLWQVAALVGALSLLSAERAAASGDEEAGQDRKKAGTKRGLFGRTFGNERSPEEGAILDEDEGYWERFLQAADNSVPTPTPRPPSPPGVCGTEILIECTAQDGDRTPCEDLIVPDDVTDSRGCNVEITYRYTVINDGSDSLRIQTLRRTQDGRSRNLFGDLNTRTLDPGEQVSVVEEDNINICVGDTFSTSATCETSYVGTDSICTATDEYSFSPGQAVCAGEVTIDCVDSFGNPCENTPEPVTNADCTRDFIYTYTAQNTGPTCLSMDAWVMNRQVNNPGGPPQTETVDLTTQIPPAQLNMCPGDPIFSVKETVAVNVCRGLNFVTTINLDSFPPDSLLPCRATTTYSVTPRSVGTCGLRIDCNLADGTPCNAFGEPDVCVQPITYSYFFENQGPGCMQLFNLSRGILPLGDQGGGEADVLPNVAAQLGSNVICTEDTAATGSVRVTETVQTNLCTGGAFNLRAQASSAPASGGGLSCNNQADYTFDTVNAPTRAPTTAAPTPVQQCDVEIATTCTTVASTVGGTGDCNAIIPIITRCDERATFMEMVFNGGDCSQSFNIQEEAIFDCTDRLGGPARQGTYYIHATPRNNPQADVYFSGLVTVGEVFPMCPGFPSCSGNRFDANTSVRIFAQDPGQSPSTNNNFVQLINFHTSCSQNLFLKDQFGSTQLVIFFNSIQGLVSCFIAATFSITITNPSADGATVVLFTNTVNGNTTDLTGQITDLRPATFVVVTTQILIDMTVQQNYSVTSAIVGRTDVSNLECSATNTINFVAGNDLAAPPGILNPGSF